MRARGFGTYAVALIALAIALVFVVLSTAPPSQNDDPSSRAAGKAGTLALYNWLGNLGFNVHRVSGQFKASASDVLLIVDPRAPISDPDAEAVMESLAHGADVVLAVSTDHAIDAAPLLNRLRITMDTLRPTAGDSTPVQPFDAADRVHHVPMAAGAAIEPAPYLTPLLGQSGMVTAVAEQVANGGRAYVLASPFPLSNDGLRGGDSSAMVLAMLERARGGSVGFDEYHHGEMAVTADGAAAIFNSPLGLAMVLAVAAVIAFLALSGRRLGHPLPVGDASLVPTTATYVQAMAGLYSRSRDRGAVASRYANEVKQRLALGGAADPADDGSFVAAVGAIRPDLAADVELVLERARALATSSPDAAALLALARDVDDLERRWAEPASFTPAQWRA
ncbi:MAG: DUF4350 domain-containing protein [Candidatus Dormibacteraeota bacterium]|uniref:DUF4350 domain-containing protein n=1 Tax=Candidatus Amunia macphersoniae TaxID=3127014 RepID=A0A934KNT3_9BACT|nr:DUF4350 domain-containing protein [Candidatus Dormibacteraeota bacterium]